MEHGLEFPEFALDEGWQWVGEWAIDKSYTDTDGEGWTYGTNFTDLLANPSAKKKKIHFVRRRRWVRTRSIDRERFEQLNREAAARHKIEEQACHAHRHTISVGYSLLTEFIERQQHLLEHATGPVAEQCQWPWRCSSPQGARPEAA